MILLAMIFVFILSFCSLFFFRKLAKGIGLVDRPNERKLHQGAIPLVGGISIVMTIFVSFLLFLPLSKNLILFLSCALVIVILGALDDFYDISFKVRLVVQIGISLAMILIGGHNLHNLGYLMGSETIMFSPLMGGVVTVLGVIGTINAFNMVDGIDGLLGGLASVTFVALGCVFYVSNNEYLASLCLLIATAMLPYIMLNLGFPLGLRFKVFMGDAGSMFVGFAVVWMLIRGSQEAYAFQPVTALWLIAIPLMDMVTIMIRRLRRGHSPFKPDREHLHHICQHMGLSPSQSLILICFMAMFMAGVGVFADMAKIRESVMFASFICVFIVYFFVISYIWRITTFIHRLFGYDKPVIFNADIKKNSSSSEE